MSPASSPRQGRSSRRGYSVSPLATRLWPWLPAVWCALCSVAWLAGIEEVWWAAIAIAVLWSAGLLAGLAPDLRSPADWPVLLLEVWLPVNYLVSVDRTLSLSAGANLLLGIGFYYMMMAAAGSGRVHWPVSAMALLGLFLPWAIFVTSARPLLLFSQSPGLTALARRLPDFINANVLAGALLPITPVSLALLLAPGRPVLRGLWAVSTALALGATVVSGSRGAWLGLGAGLVGAAFLLGGKWRLAGAAGLVGGAISLWRIGFARFAELLGKGSVVGSLAVRQEIWMRSAWAIQDFPYTGIGIGTFPRVAPQLYPFFSFGVSEAIPHAHNLVLQVGMDLGIPGLLAFLLILLHALLASARAVTRATDTWNRHVAAGAFSALLGVLVHGVVDATLWGTRPALLMWWLIAVGLAAGRLPSSGRRTMASPP